eukprot:2177795-Rhodomonas_salina.2
MQPPASAPSSWWQRGRQESSSQSAMDAAAGTDPVCRIQTPVMRPLKWRRTRAASPCKSRYRPAHALCDVWG